MTSSLLFKLINDEAFGKKEMYNFINSCLNNDLHPEIIGATLALLAKHDLSSHHFCGAIEAMRANMTPFNVGKARQDKIVDIVGTGGDHKSSINISSLSSIVVASCGLPVVKHGNRSVSSKSGSADFFAEAGVDLMTPISALQEQFEDGNFAFCFAPLYHSAMRHVAPIRKNLGFKSIFNWLGPLCNPASAKYILLGVYDEKLLGLFAESVRNFDFTEVWCVNGSGFDEIVLHDKNYIKKVKADRIEDFVLTNKDFGLSKVSAQELRGGTPSDNYQLGVDILRGKDVPASEVIIANSAVTLLLSGEVSDLKQGVAKASDAISSKAPYNLLKDYVAKCSKKK